jgi:hypothetical protein
MSVGRRTGVVVVTSPRGKCPLLLVTAGAVEQQDDLTIWSAFLRQVRLYFKIAVLFAERGHLHTPRSNISRSVSTVSELESMIVVVVVTIKIRSSGARGRPSPRIEVS